MKLYINYAAKIYSIYLNYFSKEDIHPYSIDEMFLDVTNYLKLYHQSPIALAKTLMTHIFKETKITSSCGIGTNMYLAKIALDIKAKKSPSHIGYFDESLYQQELWYHEPLIDFWQISYGIQAKLHKLHLKNMYDIAHCSQTKLYKEFGINGQYLYDHAWGIEPTTIKDIKAYKPRNKSLSNSQILTKDYHYQQARIVLLEMVDNLVSQLVHHKMLATTISLYIGYSKDIIPPIHVSFKLDNSTDNFKIISTKVLYEYDYLINQNLPIRKIGITFNHLCDKKFTQLTLFTNLDILENDCKLAETINQIKDKYGPNTLLRAISYLEDATAKERNTLIGGHNAI